MTWTPRSITAQARVILPLLPEDRALLGAEVGVHRGHTAGSLLARRPRLSLYLVDHWGLTGSIPEGRYGTEIRDEAMANVQEVIAENGWRAVWCVGDSQAEAHRVRDASLDFAHIDADHRYPAPLLDIFAWWPKVKPGGFLCGHDIDNSPPHFEPWGVRQAVEEFAKKLGLIFEVHAEEMEWVIRKPHGEYDARIVWDGSDWRAVPWS